MPDTPQPYIPRNPSDLIVAADWNEIQIRGRQELYAHCHTGDAQGPKLTGEAIDAGASLSVSTIAVSGPLQVRGRDILGEIDHLGKRLNDSPFAFHGDTAGLGVPTPSNTLDIAAGPRSGDHPRGLALYATSDAARGVEFRTPDGRSGVAFRGNGIYPAGAHGDATLVLADQLTINGKTLVLGSFTSADADEWPFVTWRRDAPGNWDEGLIKHSSGRGFFGRAGFGIHLHSSREWGLFSSGWDRLLAVEGGSGNLKIKGHLKLENSDLYFTKTDHDHTGAGNSQGWAAIENSSNYNALMIMGRAIQTNPLRRVVKLWDMLEINGGSNDANNPPFKVNHSNGQASIEFGGRRGNYTGDAIYGYPNLWLDARDQVKLKRGFSSDGFDVAERFAVAAPVQSGDVVVYDAAAAAVRPCTQTADCRVVGIVSSTPAFILGLDDCDTPVALCGRVPCKVDADFAPIEPGDLLTTSATPGHAQKAVNLSGATGAIMGKALSGLASGRGEILALVLLQ